MRSTLLCRAPVMYSCHFVYPGACFFASTTVARTPTEPKYRGHAGLDASKYDSTALSSSGALHMPTLGPLKLAARTVCALTTCLQPRNLHGHPQAAAMQPATCNAAPSPTPPTWSDRLVRNTSAKPHGDDAIVNTGYGQVLQPEAKPPGVAGPA